MASKHFLALCQRFGMTPRDRAGLRLPSGGTHYNALAAFKQTGDMDPAEARFFGDAIRAKFQGNVPSRSRKQTPAPAAG